MRRSSHRLLLLTPLLEVQAAALFVLDESGACPDCPTAKAVQSMVFGDGFWINLVLIALPLLVLCGICALLFRVGLGRAGRAGAPVGAMSDGTVSMTPSAMPGATVSSTVDPAAAQEAKL